MNKASHLLIIIVCAIGIRFVARAGYVGGDDWRYLASAIELSSGNEITDGGHWQCRTAVTLPAALLARINAPSWMIVGGMALFWSILSIPIAYWAALEFTRQPKVAFTAAWLVAIFPLDVIYATSLYPVLGISATTALAGIFFSRSIRLNKSPEFLTLGLLLGLAYLHRITALYIGMPMLVWVIVKREWHWRFAITVAAFLAIVAMEAAFFSTLEGDPLRRFHVLTARNEVQAGKAPAAKLKPVRPGGPFFSPIVALATNQEFGLFYIFSPLAVACAFTARKRAGATPGETTSFPPNFPFLILWFVMVLAYTMWGSTNPLAYKPLRPWPRYFSHTTVPLTVLLALWFNQMSRNKRMALASLLVLSALMGIVVDGTRSYRSVGSQLKTAVDGHPEEDIYITRTALMFLFYANECQPLPSNIMLLSHHPDGVDPKSEVIKKIAPSIQFVGPWTDVKDGIVLVDAYGAKRALPRWEKMTSIEQKPMLIIKIAKLLGIELPSRNAQTKHNYYIFKAGPQP